MAAPTLLQTYPADTDTGIPVGATLELIFDKGIDKDTLRHYVVLYGKDFDITSGPDSAVWTDSDGNNPFYLNSPGFQGVVELDYEIVYVDLSTGPSYTEVDPGTITSEADEAAFGGSGAGHKVKIRPSNSLAPDVNYTLHIIGDPDSTGNGLKSRTVFDVVPDGGNVGTDGSLAVYGGYTGTSTDTVVVEITTSGDIGTAKYRWYYDGLGAGSAISGLVTSRRYRTMEDGLQIRFTGSGFVSGDIYRFNVEPAELLATNTTVSFTTNDGSYTAAPSSPSTPATSLPPSTVIPPAPGTSSDTIGLYVVDMDPNDGSYWNDLDTDEITVVFSENVDASTITDTTVKVWLYPVSGLYEDQPDPIELQKSLTVSGDTLTIKI